MLSCWQRPFNRAAGILPRVPLKELLHHLLDFCYPGICASCDANSERGASLCCECSTQLDALASASACPFCAMPSATDNAPCPYCHGNGHFPFERIIRLGVFDEPLKHLIHHMKYHKRWTLAEELADRLIATER